jgi:hypothetical protein
MSFTSDIALLKDEANLVLLRNAQTTHAVFPELFVDDAMARVDAMLKKAAEPVVEEKPKKSRKATTTKPKAKMDPVEEALLLPVDAEIVTAPAPVLVPVVVPIPREIMDTMDPLKKHKHRIQDIDHSLCMGRKIDEANPIEGTRKGDEGANGMFWPEKQCSKKPLPGQKLCKICAEKDNEVKAGKPAHKQYYGRLDEPLYWNAKVIGCKHFFDKYPKGLLNDPTTAPTTPVTVVADAPVTTVSEDKKPAKKATKAKAKTTAEAPVVDETIQETVAIVADAPADIEWLTFLHKGKPLIRNLKTKKVYEMDLNKRGSRAEAAIMDKCLGTWQEDGTIDPYGAIDSDEE